MKVFLSYSYEPEVKELARSLELLLGNLGLDVKMGNPSPGTESLAEDIKAKINESEALLALLWPRDGAGNMSTSVLEEITFGLAKEKRLFVLKHSGVSKRPLLTGDLVYMEYKPGDSINAVITVAKLMEEIKEWQQAKGIVTRPPVAGSVSCGELESEGWPKSIVDLYVDALSKVKTGDLSGTRLNFQRILDIDPDCWRGVNGLAMCDIYGHQYDSAISRLDKGIKQWMHTPKALGYFWHNKGWALFRKHGSWTSPREKLVDVNECFRVALQNDPNRNTSRTNRILIFLVLDDLTNAEKECQIGLKYPNFVKEVKKYLDGLGPEEQAFIRKSDWIKEVIYPAENCSNQGGVK